MATRKTNDAWHLGKEIPIALIFAILIQSIGGIWWAATLTTKLDNLTIQVLEFKTTRYTADDAKRDFALQKLGYEENRRRIEVLELEKRLSRK